MEKKLREAQTGIAGESCAVDDEVVAAAAAAARRAKATGKHAIAAFDFDGTSIQGNSPVLLVRYLRGDDLLRKRVLAKVGAWGAAYKLHLPQSEAWVRGQVFTAFEGGPKEQVDEYLRDFYDKVIAGQKRFRPKARAAMNALREGRTSFIIAHRLSTIENADEICFIDHGQIVEQGNHAELLARHGAYYRLYESQYAMIKV